MNYKLEDLIDIKLFQSLQDRLNEIYSFPSAIIDNDGKILTAVAWQDICTKFHRMNPECEMECIKSDKYILDHLNEANPAVSYTCPHGLIDNAAPIIIDGIHYANFFTGQFFLEPPDLEFFRNQAKKYGFDEDSYIEAVKKTPVWTLQQLNSYLYFIKGLIEIISTFGLNKLRESESQIELKKSHELFQDLVETAQDLIWQCDLNGRYTYLNPAWEDVFGYKISEMLGKKFTDFQSSEWARKDLKEFARLKKGDIIKGLETVHIAKNGNEINLIFNAKFVTDESGKIIGTRGTAFDITKYRIVKNKLNYSERKYSSLFTSMNEGVVLHEVVYDNNQNAIDYRIIEANKSFERQTGLPQAKANGQLASEFYGLPIPPYLEIYSKVASTGEPTHFETYFPPLEKHFDISVFSPKKGWFATIFTDITYRKNTEEKQHKQIEELKRYNATMIDRELKMISLKEEINEYRKELGLTEKYNIPKG